MQNENSICELNFVEIKYVAGGCDQRCGLAFAAGIATLVIVGFIPLLSRFATLIAIAIAAAL